MKEQYKGLTGLKAVSIILIVLMHVAWNGNYNINGFAFNVIIKNLSVFVELFFIISAFGMCCGYYNKFKKNEINLNEFYKRRYKKILPFFAFVVICDLLASGITGKNILESFLDICLILGFLPNNTVEIVGVGWTLGVIFAFYILFPFFVFMIWTKKRAWFSLVITLIIRFFGEAYLGLSDATVNGNILSWLYLFVLGGILFLYKDEMVKIYKKRIYLLVIFFISLFMLECWIYNQGYHIFAAKVVIISFIVLIVYSIVETNDLMGNKLFVFIGGYCYEIYLIHMMVFRILEKIHVIHLFDNELVSYIFAYIITIILSLLLSIFVRKMINIIENRMLKIRMKRI